MMGVATSQALAWLRRPAPRAWLSGLGFLLLSAAGIRVFFGYVDGVYPLRDWLAWDLLRIWGWSALASLAWLSAGNLLLARVLRQRELPLLEHVVVSVALGVVAFTELMYALGALGLFKPFVAVALPCSLVLVGARELLMLWRRYRAQAEVATVHSPIGAWAWAIGGALTLVIYLGIFSPDAVNYDATWCHLTIAQDYAREGRIVPFPGDYSKNVPHLASVLHTWGFLVPGLGHPALRWMMALHQEFALFLWTLSGVAATTRFMLGGDRVRGAWVAFFLFPYIFVYDHSLGGAADHVAAFFALPALLAAYRLLERTSWERALVLGLIMAGGMLTKYQCFYWVLPLALLIVGKLTMQSVSALRGGGSRHEVKRLLLVGVTLGAAVGIFSAPHFLKNWVFYRNPVYPLGQEVFADSRPTVENALFLFNNVFTDRNWVPKGNAMEKAWHAIKLSFTFSFEPHYSFTRNVPGFGSLFTLLLPALLFIPRRGPKLIGAIVGMTTLFLWGYTFNVDRNLQVFLPILVATTGAILLEAWRLGWPVRLALAPLVAFQVIWGGDAVFYSSQDRIRQAFDLITSGYAGNAKRRWDRYRSAFVSIGEALPPDATVMLHSSHPSLGINRRIVLDWAGFQGLISYSKLRTAREVFDSYRGLGISHILYSPGERVASSIQEEVVFQSLVQQLGAPAATAGGFRLFRLPAEGPPPSAPYTVLMLGVYGYGSGVFPIGHLSTNEYVNPALRRYSSAPRPAPTTQEELEALQVDAVVVGAGASLEQGQNAFIRAHFSNVIQYSGQQTIYLPKSRRGRR